MTKNTQSVYSQIYADSMAKAFRGGISGSIAMAVNICTLMPLRTAVNYQYRYGTPSLKTVSSLYKEGGVLRFYRGFGFAIVQGPWARFGDTFANNGTMAFLNSMEETQDLHVGSKTVVASGAASLFRVISTPIDTCKTIMQVEGKPGLQKLGQKFTSAGGFPRGVPVFWYGALGSAGATFIGHYPWFFTYNYLQERLPHYDSTLQEMSRNAAIGFSASAVSDTMSNSVRVLKTYRQTNTRQISYLASVKEIVSEGGVGSLFGRGLKLKIFSNGLQGALFSVLWKWIEKKL